MLSVLVLVYFYFYVSSFNCLRMYILNCSYTSILAILIVKNLPVNKAKKKHTFYIGKNKNLFNLMGRK